MLTTKQTIHYCLLAMALLGFSQCGGSEQTEEVETSDFSQYVNPFIGTNMYDGGRTQPGAMVPNGAVTLNPANVFRDTTMSGKPGTGYVHDYKDMYGFSHLNLNGVGCHEAGSIVIMPYTGDSWLPNERKSGYSGETASPGYYSTYLEKHSVNVELTATTRTGISKFRFEKAGKGNIVLDLAFATSHRKLGHIEYVTDDEVAGYKTDGLFCGCPNQRNIYFVMKLNKKASNTTILKKYRATDLESASGLVGANFEFDNIEAGEAVIVKVGISHVSIENARLNLETEVPGFDFDGKLAATQNTWKQMLSRIAVKGGTEDDKVKFYTAVYHTLLSPFVINDVNGEYPAMNSDEILTIKDGVRYSHYSTWDTYRSLHPFLTLFYPELQEGMTRSLVDMYKESGWLPLHELRSEEIYVMVGDPSLSVIADSYAKGLRGFDVEAAYEGMLKNTSYNHSEPNDIRPCIEQYKELGYIPLECDNGKYVPYRGEIRTGVWGSVSSTLEYAYADWCAAQMAGLLGKDDVRDGLLARAQNYRNMYDEESGFFRARLADGSWMTPYDPLAGLKEGESRAHTTGKGYVEGSAWQYLFFVPHDMPGVIELLGGEKIFTERLQENFDKGYFDMTNEPDITFPYLFNYVEGEEWRTQIEVRRCIDTYFKTSFDGLPGNDDAGTLSAWLAFSMMGIFPDSPGNTTYQLTSPVFDEVKVQLNKKYWPGDELVIKAVRQTNNEMYIDSKQFNGNELSGYTIDHKDLIGGGELLFDLKQR